MFFKNKYYFTIIYFKRTKKKEKPTNNEASPAVSLKFRTNSSFATVVCANHVPGFAPEGCPAPSQSPIRVCS